MYIKALEVGVCVCVLRIVFAGRRRCERKPGRYAKVITERGCAPLRAFKLIRTAAITLNNSVWPAVSMIISRAVKSPIVVQVALPVPGNELEIFVILQ